MLSFDEAAHAYRFNGAPVPSVTQIIRGAIGEPFDRVERDVLLRAQARGKAVHKACELDDAGTLEEASVDPRIVPYVDAWRKFRREYRFRVMASEIPIYHPTYGYAGTPDLVAVTDAALLLIDRKTGLPGAAAAMQTAAYAELAVAEFCPKVLPVRRFALRMLTTGKYQMSEYTDPTDWPDFLACLRVHRLKERIAA